MDAERWKRVDELLQAALRLPPEQQDEFLRRKCGNDSQLLEEVRSLVTSHRQANSFLESPQVHVAEVFLDFASSPPQGQPDKFIGPYQLVKKIGEGGMGQVWLAQQTAPLQRKVALKLIRWGMYDDTLLHRFQAERQSLAVVDQPTSCRGCYIGAPPSKSQEASRLRQKQT